MTDEEFDITDDNELKDALRSVTQYDTSKLSTEDLDSLVKDAKRDLALQADVTSFYDDRGIAYALLGVLASKAKGAVENSPVVTKNLGGQDVTFRASDGSSLQLVQYEDMVERGLANSTVTDAGPKNIRFTGTYYHD